MEKARKLLKSLVDRLDEDIGSGLISHGDIRKDLPQSFLASSEINTFIRVAYFGLRASRKNC
jgi:hypothetical protein